MFQLNLLYLINVIVTLFPDIDHIVTIRPEIAQINLLLVCQGSLIFGHDTDFP